MNRTEFQRVSPEAVGIPSKAIWDILDFLETTAYCEPHALVIMRHGKICAEGFWAPYGKNIPHTLFSMTKTYTATALGIAYTEGLIGLEDKVADHFPEYAGLDTSPYAGEIRVRDVLTMSSGKPEVRCSTAHWNRHFFEMAGDKKPGSTFAYSCEDTHCVEALVQKVTGRSMEDYLKEKLFDKIGINTQNIRWAYLPDGSVIGCGGLFVTAEDSLRLMKLYLDGGVWDGERILAGEYVRQATASQIDVNPGDTITCRWSEEGVKTGYGFQIWTNLAGIGGTCSAHGAIGQFGVCIPELELVISFLEASEGLEGVETVGLGTKRAIAEIIGRLKASAQDAPLPEDEMGEKLARRLDRLSLGNPPVQPYSPVSAGVSGTRYQMVDTDFTLRKSLWNHIADCDTVESVTGLAWFEFDFSRVETCTLRFLEQGVERVLTIGLDGARRLNRYPMEKLDLDLAVLDGFWSAGDTFQVNARWIQTCYSISVAFRFGENGAEISAVRVFGDFNQHPLRQKNARAGLQQTKK